MSGFSNAPGRFTDRVEDYVRSRPSYPADLVALLRREWGLGPGKTVADVGSGTGILTSLLLDTGCRVIGVEPNPKMRSAAEELLSGHDDFISTDGRAEATGIASHSVDGVTAAQAFHWFDVGRTSREFRRVLRPEGGVALIWNSRPPTGSPFLVAYEAFLERWGTDYVAVRKTWSVDDSLPLMFGAGPVEHRVFPNTQLLDYSGLEGRLLSSSYTPARDDPRCPRMLEALAVMFSEHAQDGTVRMEYQTNLYYGRPE